MPPPETTWSGRGPHRWLAGRSHRSRDPGHAGRGAIRTQRAIAAGRTNPQIAADLHLSPKTVMHHSTSVYRKLGVRGRGEAVALAYRTGLFTAVADS